MNLSEKYKELKKDLTFVKKQMVFEFARYLYLTHSIILEVQNNQLLIRSDNLQYQNISLIYFFNDEFKDYHEHANLLFELSELVSKNKISTDFEIGTDYFLNFVDIF